MTRRSKQLPRAPRPSSREADGLQLASSWTRDGASLTEAERAGRSLQKAGEAIRLSIIDRPSASSQTSMDRRDNLGTTR